MQVIFKTTPHTRKFGIELEVSPSINKSNLGLLIEDYELYFGSARAVRVTSDSNGWATTDANDYWHVKRDSTCGPKGKGHDYGWEIASFIGKTESDLEDIAGAADWLSEHGIQTNDNCGYHIHVDISDFSSERAGLLLARWLKIEYCVLASCAQRRINNPYCNLLNLRRVSQNATYKPTGLSRFWDQMAPANLSTHDNLDKRYTVNMIGYRIGEMKTNYTRKTVEFRFPECLLSRPHVANWVRFLLCFVDDCAKTSIVPNDLKPAETLLETLRLVGLQNKENFYLLDEHLQDTKMWFLQKIKDNTSGSNFSQEASELLAFMQQL
jgi:hypothetical protein